MGDKRYDVSALRSVATQAKKLADAVEDNCLCEEEFAHALAEIKRALRSVSGRR